MKGSRGGKMRGRKKRELEGGEKGKKGRTQKVGGACRKRKKERRGEGKRGEEGGREGGREEGGGDREIGRRGVKRDKD